MRLVLLVYIAFHARAPPCKRTKTTLRSSMSGARLSELSFLAVHRDLALDIPKAIDEFARRHPRRMELRDILID